MKRYLIIEPSAMDAHLAIQLLQEIGECKLVDNFIDAFHCIQTEKFDAAYVSMFVPIMPGVSIVKYVKKMDSKIKLILVSPRITDELKDMAYKFGAYAVIEKPYNIKDFVKLFKGK